MVIYLALLAGLGWAWFQLPTAFLPNEDQGFLLVDMQAPGEASANRTIKVIEQVEAAFGQEQAVERVVESSGRKVGGEGKSVAVRVALGRGRNSNRKRNTKL